MINLLSSLAFAPPPFAPDGVGEGGWGGIPLVVLVAAAWQPTLLAALAIAGSDPTQTDNAWRAAATGGAVFVLGGLNGSYDGGVAHTALGFAGGPPVTISRMHTLTLTDMAAVANTPFAEALAVGQSYICWFATRSSIWNTRQPCRIAAALPVAESGGDELHLQYTLTWADLRMPEPYPLPASLLGDIGLPPSLTLTLAAGPLSAHAGSVVNVSLLLSRRNCPGFVRFVLAEASGKITLSQALNTQTATATLGLAIAPAAAPGDYPLTLTATGQGATAGLSFTLTVT